MSSEYRNPTPTVDVIIEIGGSIVLIERVNEPHGWALPGGFVDEGELLERAAIREAMEETGLEIELDALLYVYSNPSRDPRKHTMSAVFVAHAEGTPAGHDDARDARLFALDALPSTLAFDHEEILNDYKHFKTTGERPSPASKLSTWEAP